MTLNNPDQQEPISHHTFEQLDVRNLSIEKFPQEASLSEEVRWGLANQPKWSKEAGGVECASAIYIDSQGKPRIKPIDTGYEDVVPIYMVDFTKQSAPEIESWLSQSQFGVEGKLDRVFNVFSLIPQGYNLPENKPPNYIFERGIRIVGSSHNHPSERPPNGTDFSILLFDNEEAMKFVISGEKTYLMTRSKETPKESFKVVETEEGLNNNCYLYAKKMNEETIKEYDSGTPLFQALENTLIKHGRANNIAIYTGELSQSGTLSRIT